MIAVYRKMRCSRNSLADGNDLENLQGKILYLAALQKSFDLTCKIMNFVPNNFLSCMKVLQYLR